MAASKSSTPVDLSVAMIVEPPPLADWLVIAPVALCLVVGAFLLMVRKRTALNAAIAIPTLIVLVVIDTGLLVHVMREGTVAMTMGRWMPPFGITFTVDLFGAAFNLAAGVVALACGIYGLSDIDDTGRRYGFYPFLILLMAGVSGAFLTGDVFNLYVWFEVLLIASFGLLVLGSQKGQLDGATKYAFLNLVATTLFLIATGYMYGIFGTLNMADIAAKSGAMRDTAPLVTLSALFLFAFAMKAAAFPVNFWLPASYHTPRIVVAALFAGLLTKVGIYSLARILFIMFPAERDLLAFTIAVIAVLTMITGVLGAIAQNDIRRMFGYLVISGIGVMLAGLALGSPGGVSGALFYAIHSIIVMTALYMVAGIAGRLTRSFDLSTSGGLYASHIGFAMISLILFLSISGLPPFSGLWPKIVLVKASLDVGAWWLAGAILISGFLTTIAVGRVFALAYWRPARQAPSDTTVALPMSLTVPLLALTGLSVAIGIYPEPLLALTQNAAEAMLRPESYIRAVFPEGARLPVTLPSQDIRP